MSFIEQWLHDGVAGLIGDYPALAGRGRGRWRAGDAFDNRMKQCIDPRESFVDEKFFLRLPRHQHGERLARSRGVEGNGLGHRNILLAGCGNVGEMERGREREAALLPDPQ